MFNKAIFWSLLWITLFLCISIFSSAAEQAPQTLYKDVLIKDVPHVKQETDFCGEACAAMYLKKLGFNHTQDDVFNYSGLDALKAKGCYAAELKTALTNIGFETSKVWYYIDANNADIQIERQFENLHADLQKGIPAIVCMSYDEKPNAPEHFRLILGYDSKADSLIYHEPAENDGAYKKMKRTKFFELWPLKYKKDKWLLIRFRLKSHKIKPPEKTGGFTEADYAQHIMNLKEKIPNSSFTVVLAKPFVVISDEPPQMVEMRAEKTVKWTFDKLKADYFQNDPCSIIDIWLFKDDKSYRKYARQIFSDNPTTPFGYFSNEHNALIMNIATGGGTLVHEIVHPFIAANFPDCPAWFNEGLASLYEQCRDENGKIWGLTNWRLKGLKEKINTGTLPSFKELTHATTFEFYRGCAGGDNYAQARYLCYYLQENNLLRKFYHQFVSDCDTDPTGYKTLQKILQTDDMAGFKRQWEDWVLNLTFP